MITSPQDLAAACAAVSLRPEGRTWFRAVRPQFWQTGLASAQSLTFPSRFSVGMTAQSPFEVLYLAENALVALLEVRALYGRPTEPGGVISNPQAAWGVLNVIVSLSRVADLTVLAAQSALGTTAQELTGDWEGYHLRGPNTTVKEPVGLAPTQQLGVALYAVPDLEGFRVPSARLSYHENLILFPDKLHQGSSVTFSDPATGRTLSIP